MNTLDADSEGEDELWPGRVLAIAPHAEYFIGDQLQALKRQVKDLSILIPSPYFSGLVGHFTGRSSKFESLGRATASKNGPLKASIFEAKYLELPGNFTRTLTYALAARSSGQSVMQLGNYNVIHAHFIGLWGYIGNSLRTQIKRPLVLTAHGGDAYDVPFHDRFKRRVAEELVRGADRLIAVSKPVAESLVALGSERGKIEVIPNGYNSSLFFPSAMQEARSQLKLPQGRRLVLVVANLVPQKGHEYLIRAMKGVIKTDSGALLLIVGKGELEQSLRAMVIELGLSDHVHFVGHRPHEEIEKWINACDLLVLSSVKEGSPTILVESLACGKPVVATAVGGVPDLVLDGRTGFLVSPMDVEELGSAILKALAKNWDVKDICEVGKRYSWSALTPRIIQIYKDVSDAAI